MTKKFTANKLFKIIPNGLLLIFLYFILQTAFRQNNVGWDIGFLKEYLIPFCCFIVLAHWAINLMFVKYCLDNENLIIHRLFSKKVYRLSDLTAIELNSSVLPHLNLSFKNGSKIRLPPLENQKTFIKVIRSEVNRLATNCCYIENNNLE